MEVMQDMLVSIIMPMYNSEAYIRDAIESVEAQTYKNWELIVVDDGSKDGSRAIVEDYITRDARIRLLMNPHPIGMPCAPRNYGIHAARGRYIAFLDSDDMYLPNKLEVQLPLFAEGNVVIVYADYEKMDEKGVRNKRIVSAPRVTTYKSLLKGNVITMPAGIYDRSKVGTVLMRQVGHEDYVMWLDILREGGVAKNAGKVVAAVRVRGTSVSSNKFRTIGWQWNVYRKIENLSVWQSAYYFVFYAFKAVAKRLI